MPASKTSYIPDVGSHIPEDKDQFLVKTPYGDGTVIRTTKRDNGNVTMREIELDDWHTAASATSNNQRLLKPTILFTATKYPSIKPTLGCEVVCLYGRGKVVELRPENNVVVVRLSSWRLAGRSVPKCFLAESAVQVVRNKKAYEMSVFERVEHAQELKDAAALQFKKKGYEGALKTYAKAVDTVRYVQHKPDSTNTVRADLLTVMITCSNNAATCCSHLNRWADAKRHAQQAEALIEALLEKTTEGKSRIHKLLNEDGLTDARLFGEWRVKSLLVAARAALELGNPDEAIGYTSKGRTIITKYKKEATDELDSGKASKATIASLKNSIKTLESNDKELAKIYVNCKERKKLLLQKEKKRAQAMFGSSKKQSPEKKVDDYAEEKKEAPPIAIQQQKASLSAESSSKEISSSSNAQERPLKKKVTFSEEVDKNEQQKKENSRKKEEEWDSEAVIGLGIFAASIAVAAVATHYVFSAFMTPKTG